MRGKRLAAIGMTVALTIVFVYSAMSNQHANASDDMRLDCTVIGEDTVTCGGGFYQGAVVVSYAPPFSEKPGSCVGEAEDVHMAKGLFTYVVRASYRGCPLEVGDRVTYTVEPFYFVFPESPVGAIAMVVASVGTLGGFLYFRSRKPSAAS